jgi:hypothetical protein
LIYMHAAGVCFHSGYPSEVRGYIIDAIRLDSYSLAAVKPWMYLFASFLGSRAMAVIAESSRRLIHKRYWYQLNNMSTPRAIT